MQTSRKVRKSPNRLGSVSANSRSKPPRLSADPPSRIEVSPPCATTTSALPQNSSTVAPARPSTSNSLAPFRQTIPNRTGPASSAHDPSTLHPSAPCCVSSRYARVRKERIRPRMATDSRSVVFPWPFAPENRTRGPRFSSSSEGWQRNEVSRRCRSTRGGSGRPHRHDHIKKRFVVTDHAGAELIDKIKVNAVVLNIF